MTTSRMIVVLRYELGHQLGLVHEERKKFRIDNPLLDSDTQICARGGKITKVIKDYQKIGNKARRLQIAIEALSNLQLGDIDE